MAESHKRQSDNRSVMPLDVCGHMCATLEVSAGSLHQLDRVKKPLTSCYRDQDL